MAEPAPVAIDAPPPVMDTTPATADTTEVADPTPAVDTATAPAPKPKARPAVKSTKTASTKPATTTHVASAAPATAAPAAAPVAAAPSEISPPIVDTVAAETAQATPAPEAKPLNVDEDALMLGGGALALLALGGGAFAMARRRRDEDEFVEEATTGETIAAEAAEPEPMQVIHDEQPPIVAPSPSAFAWGTSQPAESQVVHDDGETWVERAYRGPTEDNPSLSLRKRLKRAAFFDAREKRVAAGKADPVDADAGLPENVANDTAHERELELA